MVLCISNVKKHDSLELGLDTVHALELTDSSINQQHNKPAHSLFAGDLNVCQGNVLNNLP